MKSDKHILQLDGLRFFAVLMVMVAHWMQWQWTNPILSNFPFVHGVILFFVLSGFLITRILLTVKGELLTLNSSNLGGGKLGIFISDVFLEYSLFIIC